MLLILLLIRVKGSLLLMNVIRHCLPYKMESHQAQLIFIKTIFWLIIGQLVVDSLNFGYHNLHLSSEQSRGVTLICKPDKDPCMLTNYKHN